MKRNRFSEEQIAAILKQGEAGMKTAELCRQNEPRGRHAAIQQPRNQ